MEKLIANVIALDKQAQAEIAALIEEKNTLSTSLKVLQADLTRQYSEATKKMIADALAALEADFNGRLALLKKEAVVKEALIQQTYQTHQQEWTDELFAFCIQ